MSNDACEVTKPVGLYATVVCHNGLAWVSGQPAKKNNKLIYEGRVGAEVSLAQAEECAKTCAEQAIAALVNHLGDISAIKKIIKMTCFIASANGFTQQSKVSDAASAVFAEKIKSEDAHARTSVGVSYLPGNSPVTIDLVAAI
jgi:enamine deaminase RidA (YjgF/YER057c/UK114 family)